MPCLRMAAPCRWGVPDVQYYTPPSETISWLGVQRVWRADGPLQTVRLPLFSEQRTPGHRAACILQSMRGIVYRKRSLSVR